MYENAGLDFETYCALDIKKVGLDRYVTHPTFRVLLGSVTVGNRAQGFKTREFDFVRRGLMPELEELYRELLADPRMLIVAHNAEFEYRVLVRLSNEYRFPYIPLSRFIDSAVVSRVAGGESKLEAAARQLLNSNKVAAGASLIKLFSIPAKQRFEAEEIDSMFFDTTLVMKNPDKWHDFQYYCNVDSELGLELVNKYLSYLGPQETEYWRLCAMMNQRGWYVDMPIVREMQRRAELNKEDELERFQGQYDPSKELNLNSHTQLTKWCKERGVKAKSFDELNVEKMVLQLMAKLDDPLLEHDKRTGYYEVLSLLETKQILGGSSLSKLQKLQDMVGPGNRLRGQYLHAGAGQTLRTSGRGVQMQNLKRLSNQIKMEDLFETDFEIDNSDLATNLRQVFKSEHPEGGLIVGDYSSVESRGLAYLAGAEWKIQGFRDGRDMYKVQAEKIFNVEYQDVTKEQRQTGKVGELSCGYGAGPGAVKDFAEKMGTLMTEGEAGKLVSDWRRANPEVVKLWGALDEMLQLSIAGKKPMVSRGIGNGMSVDINHIMTPQSLLDIDPRAQSISVTLRAPDDTKFAVRYFHGCYLRGRNVSYYRPSQTASGPAWKAFYIDQKTKQKRWFSVYGGKLSGILTQSMCRELFFIGMTTLFHSLNSTSNAELIGQFHDELVVEWTPNDTAGAVTLQQAMAQVELAMQRTGPLRGFPLEADVKFDHRYTK